MTKKKDGTTQQRWRVLEIGDLPADPGVGWTYPNPELALKLEASVRRHGQFRSVVIGRVAGAVRVLDGRRLLQALRNVGATHVAVCDLGDVDDVDALLVNLSSELLFETDFSRVAQDVRKALDAGASADGLAGAGPYDAERIGHFGTLATFDWSRFAERTDGQVAMEWDDDAADAAAAIEATPFDTTGLTDQPTFEVVIDRAAIDGLPPGTEITAEVAPNAVLSGDAAVVPHQKKARPRKPQPQGPSLFDGMEDA